MTTFSEALANALRTKLRRLLGGEPRLGERIEVHSMNAIGRRLYELHFRKRQVVSPETLRALMEAGSGNVEPHRFSLHFLLTEWELVVDAWQLET